MKRWIVTILYLAGLSLLLGLGTWQLYRGLEKQAVQVAWQARQGDSLVLNTLPAIADGEYREVHLAGVWLPQNQFLLENRIHKSRLGYEVYTPYQLSGDDSVILVNRGWLEKSVARRNIGLTQNDQAEVIHGVVYQPDKGFTLGPAYTEQHRWPRVFTYFDAPSLSDAIDKRVSENVLVLAEQHPDSFTTIWKPTVVTPERHYGYAAQWWGLAIVMLVFGWIWGRRTDD